MKSDIIMPKPKVNESVLLYNKRDKVYNKLIIIKVNKNSFYIASNKNEHKIYWNKVRIKDWSFVIPEFDNNNILGITKDRINYRLKMERYQLDLVKKLKKDKFTFSQIINIGEAIGFDFPDYEEKILKILVGEFSTIDPEVGEVLSRRFGELI